MRIRSAEPLAGPDALTTWLLGYLSEKLFAQVILPSLFALHDKIMFFLLFGWMFHVRNNDGKLVAEFFVEEIQKMIREENDKIFHERVEP